MSLKNKLQQKLHDVYPGRGAVKETTPMAQGSSVQNPAVQNLPKGAGADAAVKAGNATKLSPSSGGRDAKPPKQGDSVENVPHEDLGKDEPGKVAAAKMKKGPVPTNKGAGKGYGTTDHVDASTVINQPSSKGNVQKEDVDLEEDEFISEEEFDALSPEEQAEYELVELEDEEYVEEGVKIEFDPAVLFEGDDTLSEEFKTKAAGIFEALVTAKVTELREQIEEEVTTLATEAFAEQANALVESLDEYMTLAVNTWLEQNEMAVESGLRTEITENFIDGLKNLFAESFIDVPDEKIDVIEELEEAVSTLSTKLDEQTELAEAALVEIQALQRERVVNMVSEGLAMTQAEKLHKLTEDVVFEDEESFAAKVLAIRESFFNSKPEAKDDTIVEEKIVDNRIAELAKRLPKSPSF